MNSAPEDFEALRKLLALKRHEQPPPGYFNRLPQQILHRLQDPEPVEKISFWQQLMEGVLFRPAFTLVTCGVMMWGIAYSLQLDRGPATASPIAQDHWVMAHPIQASTGPQPARFLTLAPPSAASGDVSSTNVILPSNSPESLFDSFRLRAQPVSYSTGLR